MMTHLQLLCFIALFACLSCSTSKDPTTVNDPQIGTKMEEYQSIFNINTLKGKFVKKQFKNKGGRLISGAYDLFFVTAEGRYFVKRLASDIPREAIYKTAGNILKIKASIHNGLWDTDDPNVQSRVGTYLVVLEIL